MKKLLLIVLLSVFSVAAFGQTFTKDSKAVNVLLNFPFGISGSYEQGITDALLDGGGYVGVGGYVNFGLYEGGGIGLAVRGTFHYEFMENLDSYVGLQLGLHNNWLFYPGGLLGFRYYFQDNIAAVIEFGSYSYGNIGIAFKL